MMNEAFHVIAQDPRIRVRFGEKRLVLEGALQPYLFASSRGTMVVQGQLPEPPYKTKRKVYHVLIGTVISRDEGNTWTRYTHTPGRDDVFIEGGAAELRDGTILALDTYFLPAGDPDAGVGELWISQDDWNSLEGPFETRFEAPGVDYASGTDDRGEDDSAGRLHRSIVELPNGDLLTMSHYRVRGEYVPSEYLPSQLKVRTFLHRSRDRGRTWECVSSLSKTADVGTEGLSEPAFVRLTQGKYAGRLICLMRTGHEMIQMHSDDEGLTWSEQQIPQFGDVDIFKSGEWADQFRNAKHVHNKPVDVSSLIGAYVDPDLVELSNGVLACTFGVRIPAQMCWYDPSHRWNGNYLAFSFDQGDTWSHCVMITSGMLTTHYTGVRELKPNELYVVYDTGHFWTSADRATWGRKVYLDFDLPVSGTDKAE